MILDSGSLLASIPETRIYTSCLRLFRKAVPRGMGGAVRVHVMMHVR